MADLHHGMEDRPFSHNQNGQGIAMICNRQRRKCFSILFILLATLFLLLTPYRTALVFEYENSGQVLAYLPMAKGEVFELKYTHSIHRSDVIERYEMTKDLDIRLFSMTYEDFAVGMPEHAANGEVFQHKNGKYYITNMNRIFPSIDLRTGKVRAEHTLRYKDKDYPLSSYIEPGTWIRIKGAKLNLWQQWRGVKVHE